MDEVARSIRVGSTVTKPHADRQRLGFALGGFVAGEGCFSLREIAPAHAGAPTRRRFVFSVTVAERDAGIVSALHCLLGGAGTVRRARPRRSHWQPTVTLHVGSLHDHLTATIPFADRFLLPVARKYAQYVVWRDALLTHRRARRAHAVTRATVCTTPGCGRPVRARGLCRGCYWRETGN